MTFANCLVCAGGPVAPECEVYLSPKRVHAVLTCGGCGSSFVRPPLSAEEISRCYPPAYHQDYQASLEKEFFKGRLLGRSLSWQKSRGRFLDVGCSLGGVVAGVQEASSWEGVGVEYSPYAVEQARQLFPGLKIYPGSLGELPAEEAGFDFILVNNVLEHVPDPSEFIARVHRLLRPGGRMRLIVPNGPVDLAPNRILYHRKKWVLRTRHAGHLIFFSRQGLELLFKRTGFIVRAFNAFHVQSALKALGWFPPGALSTFARQTQPLEALPDSPGRMVSPAVAWSAPAPLRWWIYRAGRWLKFPPLPGSSFGYDFTILLEKQETSA